MAVAAWLAAGGSVVLGVGDVVAMAGAAVGDTSLLDGECDA